MFTRTLRLVFALTLLLTSVAPALEFKEARWGFDKKVVPGRFNLLSVLVSQRADERPFDGEIQLIESRGIGSVVGAPLVQQIYVTPGTTRWVQFVTFVAGEFDWTLRWGNSEKQTAVIDHAPIGAAASVVLLDPSSPYSNDTKLPGFPDDLFPTSVAATDGLDQVVLDHQPRWDQPRREAFLDWIRRGGIVHLAKGPSGVPVFDGDFASLNPTGSPLRVGAGLVVPHEVLRSECSAEYLKSAGFAPRDQAKDKDNENYAAPLFFNFDQSLLQSLAAMTKPEVAWWLLYLLTIGYLVVIGPVHYKWSRTVDYKIAIGGFLGTVAVFALAFMIAGRRGSGETQTVHSVTVARSLTGGRWDTQQWVSAFATSGDYYRLSYNSPASYFSASNNVEAVNGKAVSGKDGHFDVDIPLYSSRPFMFRGVLPGPNLEAKITTWQSGQLAIQTGPAFPNAKEVWVRRADQFLQLKREGDTWKWSGGPSFPLDVFITNGNQNMYSDKLEKMEESMRPLIANFLAEKKTQYRFTSRPLAPNQVQLYVFAKSPESFAMKGKGFKGETGWTLFISDVFRGDQTSDSK